MNKNQKKKPMNSAVVEAISELENIIHRSLEPVPPGWFTRQQYQDERKCSQSGASKSLSMLFRNGKLECKPWMILTPTGFQRKAMIYRVKKS